MGFRVQVPKFQEVLGFRVVGITLQVLGKFVLFGTWSLRARSATSDLG